MIPVLLTFTFILVRSVTSQYPAFGPAVHQLTTPVEHGEGPTWDSRTGLLYFVDIKMGKILSYDLTTGRTLFVQLQGTVTPLVQTRKDRHKFMVGVNRSLLEVEWDGKYELRGQKVLTTVAKDIPTSRFNDGKADKRGRLWFGTMGYEDQTGVDPDAGSLYFITKDTIQTPKKAITPVTVSNGLCWNKANNKFYYIDTPTYKIMEYDYEDRTGSISNPRVAFEVLKTDIGEPGLPDGMTIDRNDNLWIALHGAGCVIQVDPRKGKLIRKIAIPAQYVTSVMWGGFSYDVLFVTTSRVKLNELQRKEQPAAGSLFAVTGLGTSGWPVFEADIV